MGETERIGPGREEITPGRGEGPPVGDGGVGMFDVLREVPSGDAGCEVSGGERAAHLRKQVFIPWR
jgi:hypothetical protein